MRTHSKGHINQPVAAIYAIEDRRGIFCAVSVAFDLEELAFEFSVAAVSAYLCLRLQALAATRLLPARAALAVMAR